MKVLDIKHCSVWRIRTDDMFPDYERHDGMWYIVCDGTKSAISNPKKIELLETAFENYISITTDAILELNE